jgi:2-oxoglutarate/2-oxoacid ferredoxin oxidoreductase subunit beta
MPNTEETKRFNRHDYKGRLKPIWCPGCGDYGILNALTRGLADLEIDPDQLSVVTGIGCSSRLPGFVKCYGFHSVHGRALPVSAGVKLGNPRLTVIAAGGDGDGLSIGMGHLPHICRRNLDITYILMDNRIYGLTKGQTSPTTRTGFYTKSSPTGVMEPPMSPVELGITFGATFVARGYAAQQKQLQEILVKAIQHKGFSLVHVLTPCVTFGKGSGFDYFNQYVKPLPEGLDPSDRRQALESAWEENSIFTGIFYQVEKPEYLSQMQAIGSARGRELDDSAPPIDVESLINRFS